MLLSNLKRQKILKVTKLLLTKNSFLRPAFTPLYTPQIGMRQFCNTDDYLRNTLYANNMKSTKFDVQQSLNEMHEHQLYHQKRKEHIIAKNKHKERFGIKDYEIEDYKIDGTMDLVMTRSKVEVDPISTLQSDSQVVAFGLPYDANEADVKHIFEQYGLVQDVKIIDSVSGGSSHAIVTFKTNPALKRCKEHAKNIWLRGCLIKVRTAEDAAEESLRDRTIAISNLPRWASKNQVVKLISEIGSIVDIDFPVTDVRIEKVKDERSRPSIEKKIRSSYDQRMQVSENLFKQLDEFYGNESNKNKLFEPQNPSPDHYAVPLAERILNYERDLKNRVASKSAIHLEKSMNMKTPEKLRLINKDKRMKILSLSTLIYNESKDLNETMKNIKAEQEELVNRLSNPMDYPDLPQTGKASVDSSGSSLTEYITPQQIENLRKYMTYVMQNSDSLPPQILSEINKNKVLETLLDYNKKHGNDPLVKLGVVTNQDVFNSINSQILSSDVKIKEELAQGYEWLLDCLEKREYALKKRLDRLLKDYNKKDLILFEKKDFKNELEDINYDTHLDNEVFLGIEDIMSISEQIRNTVRNLDEENTDINYFDTPNLRADDIERAKLTEDTIDMTTMKLPIKNAEYDLHKLKNDNPLLNQYRDDEIIYILKRIEHLRATTDLPFDQLYHKEKSLIDNVVRAEKDLQEAILQSEKDLEQLSKSLNEIYDADLDILIKSRQKTAPVKSSSNADDLFETSESGQFAVKNPIEELLDEISNDHMKRVKDYVDLKFHEESKGYCFVTFSLKDEAKVCLLQSNKLFLEDQKLIMELKDDRGHNDFDPVYLKAQTNADVKILSKKEKVEAARRELESFEKTFDEHMPKTHRLAQLKRAAQDTISGNIYFDREEFPRSELENRRLKENLRDFEASTGIDVTPLYEDEASEAERIKRHKKAFDIYKSYSFLKAGLGKTKLEKKLTSEETVDDEQYKFPTSSQVARVFINDDYKIRLRDEGEEDNTPGRKLGFNRKQFIEAYLGKDSNRVPSAKFDDRKIYSFNDEMKREYSYDKLSQAMKFEEMQKEHMKFLNKDNRYAKELVNYEKRDEKNRMFKRLVSGQDDLEFTDSSKDNPYVDSTLDQESRAQEYITNMSAKNEKGKTIWRQKNLREALKDEEGYHTLQHDKKLVRRLEQMERIEAKKNKEEEKKDEAKPSEKWKPDNDSNEDEEVTQNQKDKIFSEYLDELQYDALKQGNDKKYNRVRPQFTKEYLDALSEQLDSDEKSGKATKLSKEQVDFMNDFQLKRSEIKRREEVNKYYENKRRIENLSIPEQNTLSFKEKFMIAYKRYYNYDDHKTEPAKHIKEQQRSENQTFLYRSKYSEGNEDLERKIDSEETVEFKKGRAQATSHKDLDKFIKENIDTIKFTDKEVKEDYIRSLREGKIAEGLDIREQKLASSVADKDLGRISYGTETVGKDIYDEYRLHDKMEIDQKKAEDLEKREARFLEAVMQDQKETSLDQNRTFQEFENYKRLQQVREEIEAEQEDEKVKSRMTHREWLAKLWAGKVTAKEFEETMFHVEVGADRRGQETKTYRPNRTPMRGQEEFLSDSDQQRLALEYIEKLRRTLVFNGQLTEEESFKFIEDFLEEVKKAEKFTKTPTYKLVGEEMTKQIIKMRLGEHTREYYFDPSQGVSLEAHLKAITSVPGVYAQTRVDKDGFTVIKKIIKKQYKFNLERIISNSPKQVEYELNNSIDKMVKEEMTRRGISELDEETLIDIFDAQKKLNSDAYRRVGQLSRYHKGFVDDIELFRDEILEQLRFRMHKHLLFKELTDEDIVLKRQPESVILDKFKKLYDQAVAENEQMMKESDANQEYLDNLKETNEKKYEKAVESQDYQVLTVADYKQLKEQIKAKENAKARLLKDGYAGLKDYVYL